MACAAGGGRGKSGPARGALRGMLTRGVSAQGIGGARQTRRGCAAAPQAGPERETGPAVSAEPRKARSARVRRWGGRMRLNLQANPRFDRRRGAFTAHRAPPCSASARSSRNSSIFSRF
jgi:hypothetical protein